MKNLKTGVVGLGRLGRVHAHNIRYQIPGAELTAEAGDGQVSFAVPMPGQGGTVALRLSAASEMDISGIQIYTETE